MKDGNNRYEDSLKAVCLCFALAFVLVVIEALTQGCTTNVAPIKLPEKKCEVLAVPPLPQKAVIKIDGGSIDADEGGTQILKYYVASRRLLRP